MNGNQLEGRESTQAVLSPESGVTLADLSVTLTVFAIMLLAFVPVFSRLLDSYHLRGAAQQVFSELQRARLAAVMENNRFRFKAVNGSSQYLIHDDGNNDDVVNDGDNAVITRTLAVDSPGIKLATEDIITFAPNGAALSGGRITISNRAGDTKVIAVGAGGRIRLQ